MIRLPLLRKRATHSSAVFSSGAPNSRDNLAVLPRRQLLVGDADDAGPLQQWRGGHGRGIEHHQPLVLAVDHDARRQAVDRLLQEVARLSGGPPLPLMLHRRAADQQDQHQPSGDEARRAERQDKQCQPVIVDQLADQRIDAARIRGARGVQTPPNWTITRPSVARSSSRSGGAKAADLARQQIVDGGGVAADRVPAIALGWRAGNLATGRRQRSFELCPCLAQRGSGLDGLRT